MKSLGKINQNFKKYFTLCIGCTAVALLLQPAISEAQIKASYTDSIPVKDDPGNEITQQDILVEGSFQIHQSEDKTSAWGVGLSVLSTTLDFDEPLINEVDLLKLQVPFTGYNTISGNSVLTWTLSPGLFGEHGSLSNADFRVQGQVMMIVPNTETRQWVAGLAAGDEFGEYMIYPVFGVIWSPNTHSKLTAILPMVRYDYRATEKTTYNVTFQPVGSDWTWERGDVGNTYEGNIFLTGIRLSVGANMRVSEKTNVFVDFGLTTGREFEVQRADETSISGTVELEDTWVIQVGLEFL